MGLTLSRLFHLSSVANEPVVIQPRPAASRRHRDWHRRNREHSVNKVEIQIQGEDGPSDDVEDVASTAKRRKDKLRVPAIRTDFAEDKEAPRILTDEEAQALRTRQDQIEALGDALDDGYYDEQEKELLQKPRPRPALIPLAEEGANDLLDENNNSSSNGVAAANAGGVAAAANAAANGEEAQRAHTDSSVGAAAQFAASASYASSPEDEYRMIQRTTTRSRSRVLNWKRGELLGYGAYGQVFMGLNADTGQLLAVKQVPIVNRNRSPANDQAIAALEHEIAVMQNLAHPNIVQYFGTARTETSLDIFLEFVPGGSIASLLRRFGRFNEVLVRVYTKQILLGLEYLHSHQIMHRDIKGGNILVDKAGVCKLADFGAAARLADLSVDGVGHRSLHGTPYWMAPEVVNQSGHGRQADIWSVGCTVLEMLSGKPPWSQYTSHVSAMFHIASTKDPPPFPEGISEECREFLSLCFQRNPLRRPNATRLLKHSFVANENWQPPPGLQYQQSLDGSIGVDASMDLLEGERQFAALNAEAAGMNTAEILAAAQNAVGVGGGGGGGNLHQFPDHSLHHHGHAKGAVSNPHSNTGSISLSASTETLQIYGNGLVALPPAAALDAGAAAAAVAATDAATAPVVADAQTDGVAVGESQQQQQQQTEGIPQLPLPQSQSQSQPQQQQQQQQQAAEFDDENEPGSPNSPNSNPSSNEQTANLSQRQVAQLQSQQQQQQPQQQQTEQPLQQQEQAEGQQEPVFAARLAPAHRGTARVSPAADPSAEQSSTNGSPAKPQTPPQTTIAPAASSASDIASTATAAAAATSLSPRSKAGSHSPRQAAVRSDSIASATSAAVPASAVSSTGGVAASASASASAHPHATMSSFALAQRPHHLRIRPNPKTAAEVEMLFSSLSQALPPAAPVNARSTRPIAIEAGGASAAKYSVLPGPSALSLHGVAHITHHGAGSASHSHSQAQSHAQHAQSTNAAAAAAMRVPPLPIASTVAVADAHMVTEYLTQRFEETLSKSLARDPSFYKSISFQGGVGVSRTSSMHSLEPPSHRFDSFSSAAPPVAAAASVAAGTAGTGFISANSSFLQNRPIFRTTSGSDRKEPPRPRPREAGAAVTTAAGAGAATHVHFPPSIAASSSSASTLSAAAPTLSAPQPFVDTPGTLPLSLVETVGGGLRSDRDRDNSPNITRPSSDDYGQSQA